MNGKLAAAVDLRKLANTAHLYGLGPLEELRGEVTIVDSRPSLARVNSAGIVEVTQSYDGGAPFLVWAEVAAWRDLPIPADVRSFADLEAFVPRAAESTGLDPQTPLPFMLRGRQTLVEFHVLNRVGDPPHSMEQHKKIQATFDLENVDATIITSPSSTKNGKRSRDPEMKQTRKGNAWHFGMKVHVGTDKRGVVHSLTATHAAVADITQLDELIHGEERELYGDQAYWKEADRQRFRARYFECLSQALPEPGHSQGVLPGVRPLLEALAQSEFFLALLTGNCEEGARLKLEHFTRGQLGNRLLSRE